MVGAIHAAQAAARKAVEATYFGILTVTEMGKVKDEAVRVPGRVHQAGVENHGDAGRGDHGLHVQRGPGGVPDAPGNRFGVV